jgi:hypothetical protein
MMHFHGGSIAAPMAAETPAAVSAPAETATALAAEEKK